MAAGFVCHRFADDFFGRVPFGDYIISRHPRVAVFSGRIAPDTGTAGLHDGGDAHRGRNHPVLFPVALYVSTVAGVFAAEFERGSQNVGRGQFELALRHVEGPFAANTTTSASGQRLRHFHGRFSKHGV